MSRWMVIWLLVLLLGLGGCAVGFRFAYLYRGDSEWANFAGIAGFCLAIVGFPFTIYSLFETQRAGREAQMQAAEAAREAKAAVEQARVDTKQALEKVAMMLLAGDLERLHAAVNAVLDFGDHAIWPQALLRSREEAALAAALRVNPHLSENERTTLGQGAEALALAQTSITINRLNKNTTTRGLPRSHSTNLQTLAMGLTAVRARLNATSLGGPLMSQTLALNDVVILLEEATQKGAMKWVPEEGETESFSAGFDSGAVRISRIIVGSTYLFEMLDLQGHTLASVQSSPQIVDNATDKVTYGLLERLHRCARNQALRAEDKMGALLDEIRRLAGGGQA